MAFPHLFVRLPRGKPSDDAALVFFAFLLEVPPVFLGFSRSQAELLMPLVTSPALDV